MFTGAKISAGHSFWYLSRTTRTSGVRYLYAPHHAVHKGTALLFAKN